MADWIYTLCIYTFLGAFIFHLIYVHNIEKTASIGKNSSDSESGCKKLIGGRSNSIWKAAQYIRAWFMKYAERGVPLVKKKMRLHSFTSFHIIQTNLLRGKT